MLYKKLARFAVFPLLAAGLLFLPLVAACQPPSPGPGARATNIKVGIISDMTGPTASGAVGEIWGFEDIAKWANETNYVPGVTFETIAYDNRFDVGRSLNGYELMKTRGVSVVHVQMTGANYALNPKYTTDKIVALIPPAPKALHPVGWAFSSDAAYADGAAAGFEWVLKDWAAARKSGKPKLAWLTWDADYGHAGLIANWYATEKGIDVLRSEFYPSPAPADVSAQLLRIKDAAADYVFSTGPQSAWQTVAKDAQRLGLKDRMKFLGIGNAIESDVFLGLTKEAGEGFYQVQFFSSMHEGDLAGVKWLRDIQTKYRSEWANNMVATRGALAMRLVVEAIKAAVEKDRVSADKIDGQAIYTSLEKNIKNFDTGGLSGPLTISADNHSAARLAKIFQIKGGALTPVTDWIQAPHITRFDDVKK
ncbi:MAG: ABC transporter substrate-binding protein [Chloroflexi bacterium]|nr:ABC transporter substrate-binding protein [Chloroflexota bacterium]